jgi:hypothetical protein
MCRLERWSVRTLKGRIGGMLFERPAIARKPGEVAPREIKGKWGFRLPPKDIVPWQAAPAVLGDVYRAEARLVMILIASGGG